MSLVDAAHLGEALSMVVAAMALLFAVYEHSARERAERLIKWQRVVVYELIESGVTEFGNLKLHYLAAAQQYPDFKIPNSEIQDGALKLILLSLIEAHLISKSNEDTYVVNVVSLQENAFKDLAAIEMNKRLTFSKLISKLYETLDRESGKFTIDQLFRDLEADSFGFEFEEFNVHVRELINRGVLVLDKEQRVWARSKIPPTRPPAAPPPR